MRKRIILYFWAIVIAFGVGLSIEYFFNWRYAFLRQSLWNELKPVKLENCEMSRYGAAHDGGYLLCENLMREVQVGYSYGIEGRDSWGCNVSRKHDLVIHQYDCFNTATRECEGGCFEFHTECLGPKSEGIDGKRFDSLESQIAKNGDQGKCLVVKMDIEGAEVDSLLATQTSVLDEINQLVVEFHDINDDQYLQVVRYLKKTFYVVDVHFNNYACSDIAEPFPSKAYEVLFVNKRIGLLAHATHKPTYPNPLWQPNALELPDCQKEIR